MVTRLWPASAQPVSVDSPHGATNNYGFSPGRAVAGCASPQGGAPGPAEGRMVGGASLSLCSVPAGDERRKAYRVRRAERCPVIAPVRSILARERDLGRPFTEAWALEHDVLPRLHVSAQVVKYPRTTGWVEPSSRLR